MSLLRQILEEAVSREASDVHIVPQRKPFLRVRGQLVDSNLDVQSGEQIAGLVRTVMPKVLAAAYSETHDADFAVTEEGLGRFRVNVFVTQGEPAMSIRVVKTDVPSFEELRLPEQIKDLANLERGIVLLCGTTRSGKSTTLAAIVEEINRTRRRRIVTIEDPIEYVLKDKSSVITQREVGLDTKDFQSALEHVIRQDPDVIVIGEIRDAESVRTALQAAKTGHLVLSSLHAGTADLAIPRILDIFPAAEQDPVRKGLAANLQAVICQRLLADKKGRLVPAVEIMKNTSTVRKLLETNRLDSLGTAIETGREDGMQTFNQAIYTLIEDGTVSEEEGLRFAGNPESLRMNLQGIFLDEDRRILSP